MVDHRRDSEQELLPPALKGIKLNQNVPWERSLVRLMQEGSTFSSKEAPSTAESSTLMWLGHTESRDYAVETDDEASVLTANSIYAGKRQDIHRRRSITSLLDDATHEMEEASAMQKMLLLRSRPLIESTMSSSFETRNDEMHNVENEERSLRDDHPRDSLVLPRDIPTSIDDYNWDIESVLSSPRGSRLEKLEADELALAKFRD